MELPRGEMQVNTAGPSVTLDQSAYDDVDDVSWEFRAHGQDDGNDETISPSITPASVGVTRLATAAELHSAEVVEPPCVLPDEFHVGMVVRHPEYGLGKVMALAGGGVKRTATVAFASSAGQKKFRLAQSALSPAKSSG